MGHQSRFAIAPFAEAIVVAHHQMYFNLLPFAPIMEELPAVVQVAVEQVADDHHALRGELGDQLIQSGNGLFIASFRQWQSRLTEVRGLAQVEVT